MHPDRSRRRLLSLALLLIVLSAPACVFAAMENGRPSTWARPVSVEGVPNLYKVSDSLYRSGQPENDGWKALKGLGIKTVINLRNDRSEQQEVTEAGLAYVVIPSRAEDVRKPDVLKFLAIVSDPAGAPYLVHCHHGADRTGLMVAVYRVVIEGWEKDEAIREMKRGGFGFHSIYTNISRFIKKMNVEEFRSSVSSQKKS